MYTFLINKSLPSNREEDAVISCNNAFLRQEGILVAEIRKGAGAVCLRRGKRLQEHLEAVHSSQITWSDPSGLRRIERWNA